jgi:hypothetical protein
LKNVIRFLLVLLLVVVALDRLLGLGLDYIYQHNRVGEAGGKVNSYLNLPEPPYVAIYGTSRVKYQIIPDSIPVTSFNLAHKGMSLPFQAGLLSVVAQQKKLSKTVILLADPSEFQINPFNTEKPLDAQFLRYYYGHNEHVTSYINEISRFEGVKYLLDLYRYNGTTFNVISHFMQSRSGKKLTTGWEEMPATVQDSIITLKHKIISQKLPWGKELNKANIKYLNDFVAICKANNVNLVCITTPYFYDTSETFATGRKYLDAYFKRENIPYINYLGIQLPGLENPKMWHDSHHPNSEAGRIITQDLVKRLKAMKAIPA